MAQAPPFSAFDASVHGGCGGWKCRLATEAIAGGLGESVEPARIDAGYGAYHPQIASDQVGCLPRKELTEPDAGVRIYSNPDETWPNEFPIVLRRWRPASPWQTSFGDRARPIPLLPPDLAAYLSTIGEHVSPVLLILGLATRLSALGLFGMTLVIQLFLVPGGRPEHILWFALFGSMPVLARRNA